MVSVIEEVHDLVATGRPVSLDQLLALATSPDLVRLGMLGDQARRRLHGASTTYVRVADVPLEAVATATWPTRAGELRLVGEPASASDAVDAVRALRARVGRAPVTAWSLADLERLAGNPDALADLVTRLQDADLDAVADAPFDLLVQPEAAIAAVARGGGRLARVTFRRPRPIEEALACLQRLRAIQKATGIVRVVAPLPRDGDVARPSTGYDDAKLVSLARLALDNVESIQVDWGLLGPKAAQVALLFGADDLDAVPAGDEDVGVKGRRRATVEEVRRNIAAASLVAVERDARWAVVTG